MLDDFEKAVAHLIPVCSVAAKVGKKIKNANVSGLGGNFKPGTGPKTGVELWYYKQKEFSQLSQEMMDKLKELRLPHKGKGKGTSKGGGDTHHKGESKKIRFKRIKGQVTAAIKQHLLDEAKAKEKEKREIEEIAKIISSAQPASNQDATAATAAMKLNASLKRK